MLSLPVTIRCLFPGVYLFAVAARGGPKFHLRVAFHFPGPRDQQEQFAADDSYCDYVARYQARNVPEGQGAATGAVGGAALGAAAGAIGGAGWGNAGYGAGVGAAAGGLGGLVAGAAADSANVDSVAVNNYRSCMASRGYVTQ